MKFGTSAHRRLSERALSRRVGRPLRTRGAWWGSLLILLVTHLAHADTSPGFLVIVHPKVEENSLERRFVAEAFLKKVTRWQGGAQIHPVDLAGSAATREQFSEAVLKRSVSAVKNYWRQQIFSGRGVPPPEVESEKAALHYVATHEGAIGYVSDEVNIANVKVVSIR